MSITSRFERFLVSVVESAVVQEVRDLLMRGPLDDRFRKIIDTYLNERVDEMVKNYLDERWEDHTQIVIDEFSRVVSEQVEQVLATELEAIADETDSQESSDRAAEIEGLPVGDPSELTKRGFELMSAVEKQVFIEDNDTPTYEQMYQALGRRNANEVADHFRELESKGWVERERAAKGLVRTAPLKRLPPST